MKEALSALAAMAITTGAVSKTHACACSLDRYMHNGSVMDI